MNGSMMPAAQAPPSAVLGLTANRSKEFQMELLMEKLRTKTSQYKSLGETSKAVRMAMLDKRWALDSADKAILQKCLDSLQHSIKVCSLQSLIERLECLSRQLGLKCMVGPSGVDLFISSDMFYLEILLEQTGAVKDVKIHHEGKVEQQSCEELVSCISRGDFTDFTAQLEGLTAMYQLNAEKKVKCRAFGALSALETDLATLGQIHSAKDPWAAVHKSPIGLVQNRKGGHAMKLTYFVSPYDAACCPNGILTLESISSGTGLSAQVMLESAATHKLQLQPLLPRQQTSSPPAYAPLNATNSTTLPARFVLKLSKPMVICESLLVLMSEAAQEGMEPGTPPVLVIPPATEMKPLLTLVAQNSSTSDVVPSKGLFVTLPDQNQCYFLTESLKMNGCHMTSVPFTHPAQVPRLIARLRQQALFNALISSCVRPNSKQDLESSVMVEVSALSWQHISVMLEKPGEGGMATLELELPESGSAPIVTLYCGGNSANNNSALEERLSRVVARTLSIPLVVRSLILALTVSNNAVNSRWERQGFSGAQGGPDPGGAPTPHPHASPHQGNYMSGDSQFNNQQDGGNNMPSMMGNGTPMDIQNAQVAQFTHQREEKKSKKRKHDDAEGEIWRVKKSKPMMTEDLDSSTSQSESDDESDMEELRNQMNNSSNDEEDQGVSPSSPAGFGSDHELSGIDPAELMMGSSNENKTSGSDFEDSGDGDMNDSQDVDEIMSTPSKSESKKHKQKNREHRSSSKLSTSSLLMELTEGGGLSASVSITPVTSTNPPLPTTSPSPSSYPSVLSGINLERRPGIEIIPISPNTQPTLPSSITITPISSSQAKSMDERHRSEKKSSSSGKSSKSSSSDHSSKEKKKKKKREDAMGPPDKLPPKQDPLNKPVSVSIKPTDGSHSPLSMRSSSPNSFSRKFSPGPTHGRSVSITKTGTGSPGSVKSMGKPSGSSSHHSSPRHSPVQCSPKHTFSGYSSPKNHGTSSPKHTSNSGSSGKPSMSTLKSAATGSPSSKSSSGYELSKLSKSSGKDSSSSSSGSSSREKERKSGGLSYSSSRSNSPKLKPSSVKLKQLDLSAAISDGQASSSVGDTMVSPSSIDLSKSTSSSQLSARNRKGSLSAVIDKLKSQHCSDSDMLSKSSSNSNSKDRVSSNTNKSTDSKNSSSSSASKLSDSSKTQEYMVKPSLDGMKITINKTRTKDSSVSSSKSSSFSSGSSGSGSGTSSSNPKQTSSSSQSAPGSGSPKTHTGLKPGVIGGPASKKPQVLQSSKSTPTPSSNTPISSSGASPGISTTKTSSNPSGSSSSSKVPFTKSSSGSSLSSSISKSSSKISTGSPKMSSSATDLSKQSRDREREKSRIKGTGEKSIFSSSKSAEKRSSPAPTRDDVDGDRAFKMLPQHKEPVNFIVEGFIKTLDTSKYQIPKLSARSSGDDPSKSKSSSSDKSSSSNVSGDNRPKLMDYMGRPDSGDSKYQFQHGSSSSKSSDQISKSQSSSSSSSKPAINLTSSPKLQNNPIPLLTSPKLSDNNDNIQPTNFSMSKSQSDSSKDVKSEASKPSDTSRPSTNQVTVNLVKEDSNPGKVDFQKSYPAITVCSADTINQSLTKQMENKTFASPQIKTNDERKLLNADHVGKPPAMGRLTPTQQDSTDMCLDFSSSSNKPLDTKNKFSNAGRTPMMPLQSPSLSVHIVKSPSPHSSSPCITDDELMDEAIVGPGK